MKKISNECLQNDDCCKSVMSNRNTGYPMGTVQTSNIMSSKEKEITYSPVKCNPKELYSKRSVLCKFLKAWHHGL